MRWYKLCPVHPINSSSNWSLKSLFMSVLQNPWILEHVHMCVCTCAFVFVQVCVHPYMHIDGKSRDMSTVKFCWSGRKWEFPQMQHISTTKERRSFFKGYISCLRDQSNSDYTLLLSPSHCSFEGPTSPRVSGNYTAQTLVSAFRKLKWSTISWFSQGYWRNWFQKVCLTHL